MHPNWAAQGHRTQKLLVIRNNRLRRQGLTRRTVVESEHRGSDAIKLHATMPRATSKLHFFERNLNVDGTRVDPAIIEQERPAIVIQEFVERKLMCLDLREC